MTAPSVAIGLSQGVSVASLDRVVACGGALRGVTWTTGEGLSFVVDVSDASRSARAGVSSGVAIARILAGIERPTSGTVRTFGVDPCSSPQLRRDVALLGDPALLADVTSAHALATLVSDIARIRNISALATPAQARALVASLDGVTDTEPLPRAARIALADRLAAADRARLVVIVVTTAASLEGYLELARTSLARGASVVVVTNRIDRWLHAASPQRASAVVVEDGLVLGTAPAHQLPWSQLSGDVPVRSVTVSWREREADVAGDAQNTQGAPTSRLLHRILDAVEGDALVAVERIDATSLRIRTREPRVVARTMARLAHEGLEVTALAVEGAQPHEIAGQFRGRAR